jgi:DNA-binding MarR family transcriptional regulator
MATTTKTNATLLQALAIEMRESSAIGVLHSEAMARIIGIHSTDLECLDLLTMKGPLTAGELGVATALTTGAITGVIDRLERRGFVYRQRSPTDRRRVIVNIAPDTHRQLAPVGAPMRRRVLGALSRFSRRDLAAALAVLGKAREAARAALADLRDLEERGAQDAAPRKKGRLRSRV